MRATRALVLVLAVVALAVPAVAEETFGQKILSAGLSSAGSKGGEFAVKFVTGWIYNISCKPEQQTDQGSKALCSALGSVSGKGEEEWKKKIEDDLKDIKNKLGVLESGQKQIINAIASQHKEMNDQFKQLPNAVRVSAILTTIDSFWGRFKVDISPDAKTSKTDLEKFAKDVMRANLHKELSDLNSLLTHPIDNAQPLINYPFYRFRQTHSLQIPSEAWPGLPAYDFAEKKFMYYRGEQQKGYIVYLWAAEIIEGECELAGDTKCDALPITSKAFVREFDRFTREQIETFDAAAHGMVLTYSKPHSDTPDFLIKNVTTDKVLMRINYLTSTILGSGQGAWGEVISADGDPWDGKIQLQCAGQRTVSPEFSYAVPADTKDGPRIDWWISRQRNGTYDEVHFTPSWRVYHYKVEDAPVGSCKVDAALPGGSRLPWVSPNGEVAKMEINEMKNGKMEKTVTNIGFFYGLQRAGGTYALASGQSWALPGAPETRDEGDAKKKDTRFDWVISDNHHEGLWVSLLNSARVDHNFWTVTGNANHKAYVMNRVYAYNRKSIWFPEGGTVKLNVLNHNWCEKVCRGTDHDDGFMDYSVENSAYEAGTLNADVAVFFDPKEGLDNIDGRKKNGIYIDGSYGGTTERKTKRVDYTTVGSAAVNPDTAYHLQYFLGFELTTYSKRVDPTHYHIMLKMTPRQMYLSR